MIIDATAGCRSEIVVMMTRDAPIIARSQYGQEMRVFIGSFQFGRPTPSYVDLRRYTRQENSSLRACLYPGYRRSKLRRCLLY